MPVITTLTQIVEHQTKAMLAIAKRVDERGYAVIVWGYGYNENLEGVIPLRGTCVLTQTILNQWKKEHRRRIVVVDLSPHHHHTRTSDAPFTLDEPFNFTAHVPRTTRLRSIVATLDLMSARREGRYGTVHGTGILTRTDLSSHFEFNGSGKAALTTVLQVLEMPQHREALMRK